jgi:hypothetical protein
MDLVTATQAIEKIKLAKPGSTLYIGLYKDAKNEEGYKELATLLGCSEDSDIFDGPYKIYSEFQSIEKFTHATGWISGNVYQYYKNNLGEYGEIPAIGGLTIYPDVHSSLNSWVNALNETAARSKAKAEYDPESNRVIITATTPGEAGNKITLAAGYNDGWPLEYGLKCSEGGTLSGGETYVEEHNISASHIWIKNTLIPRPLTDEDDDDDDKKMELTIKMTVKPGFENYPLELNFTQRWKFDEFDEVNMLPIINWGDGNEETITDITNIKHAYSEAGDYEILMYNIHWTGWNNEEGAPATNTMPVTEIEFIKPQILLTPSNCLRSLEILKKVSGKIYTSHSYRSSSGHSYMFLYDAELDDLSGLTIHFGPGPDGKGITTLNSLFWGCPKVTSAVLDKLTLEHYDKNLITSSQYLFNGANINSINNKLLGSNLMQGQYVYSHCNNLTHLDGGILDNLVSGQHMFENTNIVSCDTSFGLPSLINGDCMFFGTEMPFKVIKQIYESLTPAPEDADYGVGSNNEPENYAITFGYNIDEENITKKLAKLFNIDLVESGGELPFWIHGQYDNSNDKRWYISFTNRNKVN